MFDRLLLRLRMAGRSAKLELPGRPPWYVSDELVGVAKFTPHKFRQGPGKLLDLTLSGRFRQWKKGSNSRGYRHGSIFYSLRHPPGVAL
ncbi:MAG: hypothetical protein JSU96_07685, partial [Acidobacteriota bacterium]